MSDEHVKIIDIIRARQLTDPQHPAISLEFFPPRSADGVVVRTLYTAVWLCGCCGWLRVVGLQLRVAQDIDCVNGHLAIGHCFIHLFYKLYSTLLVTGTTSITSATTTTIAICYM
jgi:hypothetical protein